jgi:Family of unknown function (DUF6152)
MLRVLRVRAREFTFWSIAFVLLAFILQAFGHHSISAEFDTNRRTTLTGIVTKVEWANPHTFFYLDVRDPKNGDVTTWACELGSPNMLATLGWTNKTLKVGMTVSLTGILARDGTHKLIARSIVADGVRLTAWPSEQNAR